ncbi:MAG: type II toxin-antitoxin system RelE/ParE family toxin [Thermoplasmatales archaeon]|nr:MAG: type II toxin-antitoxin system RelE/ParE family toxin [Thermoplasmatales archaeon]
MVREVAYSDEFKNKVRKLDSSIKMEVKKKIGKIINKPDIGKPMRYSRKGTRELYISSFRLSYKYDKTNDIVILLDFYHKDEQ